MPPRFRHLSPQEQEEMYRARKQDNQTQAASSRHSSHSASRQPSRAGRQTRSNWQQEPRDQHQSSHSQHAGTQNSQAGEQDSLNEWAPRLITIQGRTYREPQWMIRSRMSNGPLLAPGLSKGMPWEREPFKSQGQGHIGGLGAAKKLPWFLRWAAGRA